MSHARVTQLSIKSRSWLFAPCWILRLPCSCPSIQRIHDPCRVSEDVVADMPIGGVKWSGPLPADPRRGPPSYRRFRKPDVRSAVDSDLRCNLRRHVVACRNPGGRTIQYLFRIGLDSKKLEMNLAMVSPKRPLAPSACPNHCRYCNHSSLGSLKGRRAHDLMLP